jgi:transposase-like protein
MNCTHPHLTHVINSSFGGLASTTYRCQECKQLLTVTLKPLAPVKITYPKS